LEAISRVDEDDTAPLEALPLPTGSITVEPDDAEIVSADEFFNIPAAAATSEIPSWLQLQVTEEDDAPAVAGDLPDWLREAKPADIVPASEDELAWLRAEAVQGDAGDLPDWLQMVPPAAPVVEPPAPEPIVARVETRPEPPPASKPAPKVEPKPRQPGRLLAARENVATNLFSKAMELYQQLIDDQEDLEETRADLRTMVENNPKEPKLRRLLGDTHMRLGDLQSALDSYRSALDQL
jgi:tetratricopeptide (TPR) repeat protein